MTRRRRSGFSLIEALVALTIAAVTLAAIFELQVQMVRGQQRAVEAMAQVAAQENALALTRDINPMLSPEGRISLPEGDTVSWVSEPLGPPRQNAGFPNGNGIYQVQLFRLTVRVERAGGRSPAPLVFNRLGWANAVQSAGR